MHRRPIRWQFCHIALVMATVVSLAAAQTTAPPAKPPPTAGTAPPSAAAAGAPASKEQLEQLLAPIALYPDSLLSQVLMAATYPADVAEAAKWVKAHPDNKGDSAVKAVENQPWDPSVQSLAAFPQILDMMGAQPDWVQKLGDAFLASSKDVLDAVQRLRQKAQQAGNLKSTEQQKVIVEQEPTTQQTVIKVEPAQPETVYVPAYNPTVVYGAWPYPSYPPYYYPPPPYYYPGGALASGIAFGIGRGGRRCHLGRLQLGPRRRQHQRQQVQQRQHQPPAQRQPDELPAQRRQPQGRAVCRPEEPRSVRQQGRR